MTQIAIYEQFTGLKVDRQIKAVIGMSRDKFDQLVPVFTASYAAIQQERLQNKEIKKLPWGGRDPVLDTPERRARVILREILIAFALLLTFMFVGESFLRVMNLSLTTLKTLPVRHLGQVEDFKQVTDNDKEIIIDGIEVPCVRPGDPEQQKTRYSGKKKDICSRC